MDYENHNGVMRSGKIALYNMDCMELLRQTPDKYYSLCVVDPPYGIGAADRGDGTGTLTKHKWKNHVPKKWDSSPPNAEYFIELRRVSVNQIIWGANHYISRLPHDSPCWLSWDKMQEFSLADFELAWTSFRSPCRAFRFTRAEATNEKKGGDAIHPTQKPIALYEWLLTNYAKPGQRILDTHLGSGSSAIAAHNLGFDFVGTELDADYYAASVRRFEAHKAQKTLFQPDDYDRVTRDYQENMF